MNILRMSTGDIRHSIYITRLTKRWEAEKLSAVIIKAIIELILSERINYEL